MEDPCVADFALCAEIGGTYAVVGPRMAPSLARPAYADDDASVVVLGTHHYQFLEGKGLHARVVASDRSGS